VDATPIATPTDLPPLPTGTFALPLVLNKSPSSCFNDTTQSQAWSCSIAFFGSALAISIANVPPGEGGKPGEYEMTISSNQSNTIGGGVFWYGEQAPNVPGSLILELVNDTYDTSRGPAWFKMIQYNKTVVVPESLLSTTSSSLSNRRLRRDFGPPFHRKGLAQSGDRPWVCTWPDTLLEVFIYPNLNTSLWKIAQSSASSVTTTSLPNPSTSSYDNDGHSDFPHGLVTGGSFPTARLDHAEDKDNYPQSTPTTSSPTPSATALALSTLPAPYPRVVKVEERRMARSREATCIQYELRADVDTGAIAARPIFDNNGNLIEIRIAEEEPGPAMQYDMMRRAEGSDANILFSRDNTDLSDCGCLWMVT